MRGKITEEFYVSRDEDNSTGNSWQTVYQSNPKALSKMQPGDRCYLKIGSYPIKQTIKLISGITLLGGYLGEGAPGERSPNEHSIIDAAQIEDRALIIDASDCEGTLLEGIGIDGGKGGAPYSVKEQEFRYIYKE